jgi:hypothetical protein
VIKELLSLFSRTTERPSVQILIVALIFINY